MQIEGQRVSELADELGYNKQELVTRINELELGFTADNFMTRLDEKEVEALKEALDEADTDEEEPSAAEQAVQEGIGPTTIRSSATEPQETETVESSPGVSSREPSEAETSSDDEPATEEAETSLEDDEAPDLEAEADEADEFEEVEADSAPSDDSSEVEEEESDSDETVDVEADEAADPEPTPSSESPESEASPPETPDSDEPELEADDTPDPGSVEEEGDPESEDSPELEADADDAPSEETEEAETVEASDAPEASSQTSEPPTPEAEGPSEPTEPEPTSDDPQEAQPAAEAESPPQGEEEDGAQRVGKISQKVIQDRLAAEGKEFEEEEEEDESQGGPQQNQQKSPHRRVVEGQDLYDEDSRNRNRSSDQNQQQQQTEITQAAEHKRVIEMEEVISVSELAEEMGVKAGEVAMKLMESGMQATANTSLDYETATLIAEEFGYKVKNTAFDIAEFYDTSPDPEDQRQPRPPVVTVMGHVDHGKTTLLDAIRQSDAAEAEHGGITQHIGAYQVHTGDGKITFIDTPGHEAFTALRARGAKATDLVILVVAADDGVMPQTVEAINHAQDADVPILVAINKIDKPTSNPDRVKQALTEYELVPEEWGGTTLYEEVSAKQTTNIDELLESIHLQSELEGFSANPERRAQGIVIESELDVGRGPVASVLVQRGTLHQSDIVVSGQYHGHARTMHDDRGREVDEAGPSQPVEITGLDGVPEAGEPFFVVESESDAQRITEHVEEQRRKEEMASRAKEVTGSVEDLSAMIQEGELKELKVIIKGDVQGSVEALKEAFDSLGNDEVQVQVIHSGVGSVTENDVNLAASSETAAVIVGFNVRPDQRAKNIAEKQGVQILTHSVIYDAIDQVKKILEGLLEPIVEERVLGEVEVRELFESAKAGTIAGCYVTEGEIHRNANARLIRDGRVVYDTGIASLKRYEEDVREVREGYECGLSLEGYNDIKIGDTIEVYDHEEITPTLN